MSQDDLYGEVFRTFGDSLDRLARSYEADPEKRRDLLQEIHFAIWRSFATFSEQCSLRTWVYRVAHNVASSYVMKQRRLNARPLVTLEDVDDLSGPQDPSASLDRRVTLDRLYAFVQRLDALDRQVMLLYLEGLDADSIAEITGISSGNVATKVHRIKKILIRKFAESTSHES
jgi:RNA polymerase sigma-70 factor (ECF subfamily)